MISDEEGRPASDSGSEDVSTSWEKARTWLRPKKKTRMDRQSKSCMLAIIGLIAGLRLGLEPFLYERHNR